jgi:hypothetical protein
MAVPLACGLCYRSARLIDTGLTPKVRLPRLDAARLADLEREADRSGR